MAIFTIFSKVSSVSFKFECLGKLYWNCSGVPFLPR
jgi:hypothetical protein